MNRIQGAFVLVSVAAVATDASNYFAQRDEACFTEGSVTYMISQHAPTPDYRVRIDSAAVGPVMRMLLVERPEIANFVLADDVDSATGDPCRSGATRKTIRIVDHGPADLTVALSPDPSGADHTIYVHSTRFSSRQGAALFAVMQHRSNMDRTGNIR